VAVFEVATAVGAAAAVVPAAVTVAKGWFAAKRKRDRQITVTLSDGEKLEITTSKAALDLQSSPCLTSRSPHKYAKIRRPQFGRFALLIRGFGVRAPGGAPALTWYCSFWLYGFRLSWGTDGAFLGHAQGHARITRLLAAGPRGNPGNPIW